MGQVARVTIEEPRLVALDFETADSHDRIIEIGCVELRGTKKTGRTFHRLVKPRARNRMYAFGIHGIREAQLEKQPYFEEVADELLTFLADSTIISHSESYERHTLRRELERLGRLAPGRERFICTLKLARAAGRFGDCTLATVAGELGVYRQGRRKGFHDALTDAHMAADIYLRLSPELSAGTKLPIARVNTSSKRLRHIIVEPILKPRLKAERRFLDTPTKIADWWRSVEREQGPRYR
jgi:DNA polymerase III subunit epsilon